MNPSVATILLEMVTFFHILDTHRHISYIYLCVRVCIITCIYTRYYAHTHTQINIRSILMKIVQFQGREALRGGGGQN